MAKDNVSGSSRKGSNPKIEKPRPDFPLFPHHCGRWAKKIRGRFVYFRKVADDPQGEASLTEYLDAKEDLHAGRAVKRDHDALTVRELCNRFISSKRIDLDAGKLSPRTFIDYDRVCRRLVETFGATRAVTSLGPSDFEKLYSDLVKRYNVNTQSGEITMSRSVFKYAVESDLIDKAVKFGPKFKVPSKVEKRKAKARSRLENGSKMFEAAEIRKMLDAANPQLRAMILLGVNGGLGNTDCAGLPLSALDLDAGWLDYARAKTGIGRRVPLWPETVAALREVIAKRKTPADPADADVVFVTKYGQRWVRYSILETKSFGKISIKPKQDDAIAKETAKLLRELGIKRHGVGFYALRHVFETIAGESRDQVVVDAIMGHVDNTMAGEYRERISDDRLRAVVEHVRGWLYAKEAGGDQEPGDENHVG